MRLSQLLLDVFRSLRPKPRSWKDSQNEVVGGLLAEGEALNVPRLVQHANERVENSSMDLNSAFHLNGGGILSSYGCFLLAGLAVAYVPGGAIT